MLHPGTLQGVSIGLTSPIWQGLKQHGAEDLLCSRKMGSSSNGRSINSGHTEDTGSHRDIHLQELQTAKVNPVAYDLLSSWSDEELIQNAKLLGLNIESKAGQFRRLFNSLSEDPQPTHKYNRGKQELASLMKDGQNTGMVTRKKSISR